MLPTDQKVGGSNPSGRASLISPFGLAQVSSMVVNPEGKDGLRRDGGADR